MEILQAELAGLADSPFGRSARGQALISEIERLAESDAIVFSSGLGGPRGLTRRNVFGTRRVYVKVIEMNRGRYLHQLPWQLSEALFHEAVHSSRAGFHGGSFEEECDAFAAGLQAEAASRGVTTGSVFRIDGIPVAEFVERSYPGIRHDTRYRPVGESLDWLARHVRGKRDRRRKTGVIQQPSSPDSTAATGNLAGTPEE